jgi:hypothetical protein
VSGVPEAEIQGTSISTTATSAAMFMCSQCSGDRPVCKVCEEKRTSCLYDVNQGETRVTTLKSRVRGLAEDNERLASVCNALRSSSESEAQQLLAQIRAGSLPDVSLTSHASSSANPSDRRASFSIPNPSAPEPGIVISPTALESASRTSSLTSSETRPGLPPRTPTFDEYDNHFEWRILDTKPAMTFWLPRQSSAKTAIFSFYECNSQLFHVCLYTQGKEILDMVYTKGGLDPIELAEMLAMIAVGSQNTNDRTMAKLGYRCYDMARSILDDIVEAQSYRSLRTFTFLALYDAMRRRTMAILSTQLGLAIANRHGLDMDSPKNGAGSGDTEWLEGKRIWRVLVCLDMWLSSTLGTLPTSRSVSTRGIPSSMSTITDLSDTIQSQIVAMSVLTARLVRALFVTGEADEITQAIEQIRTWHRELPPELQSSVSSTLNLPLNLEMSVHSLHLLYDGTLMLLYRRIVLKLHPAHDKLSAQTMEYVHQCSQAAKNVAERVRMFLQRNILVKRYWLLSSSAFVAGGLVLRDLAQKLSLQHDQQPGIQESPQELLYLGQECVKCLAICAETDATAKTMHDTLLPHITTLERGLRLRDIPVAMHDLERISHDLNALMKAPFAPFLTLEVVAGDNTYRQSGHPARSATLYDPNEWWLEVPSPYNWPFVNEQPPNSLERMMATLQAEL